MKYSRKVRRDKIDVLEGSSSGLQTGNGLHLLLL